MRSLVLALALLPSFARAAAAPAAPAAPTAFERECAALSAPASGAPHDRLWKLFDAYWRYQMTENPEYATYTGYPGQNARWTDLSLEAIARRKREISAPLAALRSIDRAALDEDDRLDYDLLERHVAYDAADARFPDELMPINQLGGAQQDLSQLLFLTPKASVKDYEDILARLRGVSRVIDQELVLLRAGLAAGVTPPQVTLKDVPAQIEAHMSADPEKNPLLEPFKSFPAEVPEADRARLKAEAARVLASDIAPAFARLHDFFAKEYLPKTRTSLALTALPNGQAWYAQKVARMTTSTLSPRRIHEIGLAEVKRIRAEMDKARADAGFKGDLKAFAAFLRSDPRFFHADRDSLLRDYRAIAKSVDPELVKLFGRLPRLTYGVIPVPDYAEKSQPDAYYNPGTLAGGRPGYFYANLYDLPSRPSWQMESLVLHEAVPGHHFQISLAQELEKVPEFRRYDFYSAFGEGWGLYSESLGADVGLYKDPYSRYGRLVNENWRAVRLVVDTGIHALGWSRERAIDFFLDSCPGIPRHSVEVEVDRYIVWPGQALSYKIGELKFQELKALARKELGAKFDVRAFHDVVLSAGTVPLDVVEERVKAWIAKTKAA